MTKGNSNAKAGEILNEEPREVSVNMSALESQTRGEIDIQIVTAKRYPRSLTDVKNEAVTLVSSDKAVAESCFYTLKRKGSGDEGDKIIKGGSSRLAEIMAYSFGHMRIDARIVNEDDKFITARGTAWDLQKNVAIAYEVRRRISGRYGKFSDDMISVTANAASSIALRNAVFKVIPKPIWEPVYRVALDTAAGKGIPMAERRQRMLEHFKNAYGVSAEQVFAFLGIKGLDDVTIEHITDMIGVSNSIRDGETKLEEQFPPIATEPRRAADAPPAADAGDSKAAQDGATTDTPAADDKKADDKKSKGKGKAAAPAEPEQRGPFTASGLKVLSIEYDEQTKLHQMEMHAGGDAPVSFFMSRDKAHADMAASVVESDHTVSVVFMTAELSTGEKVKHVQSITVDDAGAKK